MKKRLRAHADEPDRSMLVHVAEPGVRSPKGALRCAIGAQVAFSTESLESYFFATWEPVAYDALLVAAAVEFADKSRARSAYKWERRFELRIPVHDVGRWETQPVKASLVDALSFLTGDRWDIAFYQRAHAEPQPRQGALSLHSGVEAVIPFSNGLDSRAVAGLVGRDMGTRLVRIRLGAGLSGGEELAGAHQAFTAVPYKVSAGTKRFAESSARSRGFKFSVISGLAAYLANAHQIIVPESGQGALGPALVSVGQAYEDYRSHPVFTVKMERFLKALLGRDLRFVFPRLWSTKGETLKEFVEACDDSRWAATWSCWRQSRHVSVDGRRRQCGVCAACMLRRMSVHAAGLSEDAARYVWEDLSAPSFEKGVAGSYRQKHRLKASREYAIAGALHMDHMAALADAPALRRDLELTAFQLAGALGLGREDVRARLERLIRRHSSEWEAFLGSLGSESFVAAWAMRGGS